jgi:hypothetical protein
MTGVEWRIAALCGQLRDSELSQMLIDAGAGTTLTRVLDAVRAGDLGKVSAADLDGLEDAAASIGIDGLTTGVRAVDGPGIVTRLPGIGRSSPDFAWICPQHACTRVELGTPDVMPVCPISGRELERRTQPG